MLDLSIIFVSHGHEALLPAALAGIAKAIDGLSVEVLLVDNLNQPGFGSKLGNQPFDIWIFSNRQPQGLARNTNQAATAARGRFLLMLNPDTEYRKGRLKDAIDFMDQHPDAGLLGCRLLNADGSLQRSYRKFPVGPVILIRGLYASRWPVQPAFYRRSLMENFSLESPSSVDWVLGAWLLMRRDDLLAMHGMDEDFFLYYEDIDLCYRIHQRGHSVVYFPALEFHHKYDRGSAKKPLGKAWQMHAGSICRYFWKHRYLFRPRYGAANAL